MPRRLRPSTSLIAPEVERTIAALTTSKPTDSPGALATSIGLDAAVVRLAQRYAAVIDDEHEMAVALADLADAADDDGQVALRLAALRKRLDAWEALAELGPRLLATLEALGATPRARAAQRAAPAVVGGGKLAGLRAARPIAS